MRGTPSSSRAAWRGSGLASAKPAVLEEMRHALLTLATTRGSHTYREPDPWFNTCRTARTDVSALLFGGRGARRRVRRRRALAEARGEGTPGLVRVRGEANAATGLG